MDLGRFTVVIATRNIGPPGHLEGFESIGLYRIIQSICFGLIQFVIAEQMNEGHGLCPSTF
jgi:hypothetical protein